MISVADITAVLLCGGKGARLGGQDKPLLSLSQDKLIDHLLARLKPQAGKIIISCSRNVARYEAYGLKVIVDESPNEGPLGGLQSAFSAIDTEWALTCPGDIPFLTPSLVTRMRDDAERQGIAVPFADNERQNLCLLINQKRREFEGHSQSAMVASDTGGTGEEAPAFPPEARLCLKCQTKAAVMLDGCMTCLNCGDSKCG
ncbi:MAG: NTP transferase domain-containing protein [Pseudomonadales bacterium]|nr:NTP transferase domain-containing protein [Pseudomonadales bacterium]